MFLIFQNRFEIPGLESKEFGCPKVVPRDKSMRQLRLEQKSLRHLGLKSLVQKSLGLYDTLDLFLEQLPLTRPDRKYRGHGELKVKLFGLN